MRAAAAASSRAEIARPRGGWISFARYMELALHEPGLGYYAGGARKFGARRRLRHRARARRCSAARSRASCASSGAAILELGAGSGALAEALLRRARLRVLDPRDQRRAARAPAQAPRRPGALPRPPARSAFAASSSPTRWSTRCRCTRWPGRRSGVMERGVASRSSSTWQERPASGALLEAAQTIQVPIAL